MRHETRESTAWLTGILTALALAGPAQPAHADGELSRFWNDFKTVRDHPDTRLTTRVEFENDLVFNTDRNYTSGVRLITKYAGAQNVALSPEQANEWFPPYAFDGAVPDAECEPGPDGEPPRSICVRKSWGFVLGHTLYTPSDIRLPPDEIPAGDRPYAAWLYLGLYRELYANNGRYWRYGFDIGCMGPCARGESVQKWIHKHLSDSPAPQGWDRQIRNEIGFVFRYEHVPMVRMWNPYVQWRPIVDFGIGTIQTYAGAGMLLRFGVFRPQYLTFGLDNHPIESLVEAGPHGDDAGMDAPRPVTFSGMSSETRRRSMPMLAQAVPAGVGDNATQSDAAPVTMPRHVARYWGERKHQRYDLYGFARVHGTLVAYNALLQGGLFNRSSPMKGAARPFIAEAELGMTFGYDDFSLTASIVHRYSDASMRWRHPDHYKFGRIAFEWAF